MILVDQLKRYGKREFCHMVSDESMAELHFYAHRALGIKRCWFEHYHYDINREQRKFAILMGAKSVTSKELVKRMWKPRKSK